MTDQVKGALSIALEQVLGDSTAGGGSLPYVEGDGAYLDDGSYRCNRDNGTHRCGLRESHWSELGGESQYDPGKGYHHRCHCGKDWWAW